MIKFVCYWLIVASTLALGATENQKAEQLFEQLFRDYLKIRPEFATYIGEKVGYKQWNDYSLQGEKRRYQQAKDHLPLLKSNLNREGLNCNSKLVYDLISYPYEEIISHNEWPDLS